MADGVDGIKLSELWNTTDALAPHLLSSGPMGLAALCVQLQLSQCTLPSNIYPCRPFQFNACPGLWPPSHTHMHRDAAYKCHFSTRTTNAIHFSYKTHRTCLNNTTKKISSSNHSFLKWTVPVLDSDLVNTQKICICTLKSKPLKMLIFLCSNCFIIAMHNFNIF